MSFIELPDLNAWSSQPAASPDPGSAALQAYYRQLGFSEAEARSNATTAQRRTAAQSLTQLPAIRDAGVEARRSINQGMEARGLYRSGETERANAIQRREEERDVYGMESSIADAIGRSESDLAWTVADLRNRRSEA